MRIGIDANTGGSHLGGNDTYIAGMLDALGRAGSSHKFIGALHQKSGPDARDGSSILNKPPPHVVARNFGARPFIGYFASKEDAESWRGRCDNVAVRQLRTRSRLASLLVELVGRVKSFFPLSLSRSRIARGTPEKVACW